MINNTEIEIYDGTELHKDAKARICNTNDLKFSLTIKDNGMKKWLHIDNDTAGRHFLLLGGIGTGKTNTFLQIISQLKSKMHQDDVMVIFDTKGDFYENFYNEGDVVIGNRDLYSEDYWNIFNEISDDGDPFEQISEMSSLLFKKSIENSKQPFFPNAAKDIFSAVVYFYYRFKELGNNNRILVNFLRMASAEDLKKLLLTSEKTKYMVNYINNPESGQTQGVLSEMYQVINEIFISDFSKEGNISMRNIIREKNARTVFIEYDLAMGNRLGPIYSLLFDTAIKEALSRKRTEGNVYFIVDEFSLLPYLEHIDDAVNFGRSLGVKFMIGIQNISQVVNNYGKDRAYSLLSGFLNNISFNVHDMESREFIKNIYGKNIKKTRFNSVVQSKGINEDLKDSTVVEDKDINALGRGEAIVSFYDSEPFVCKFARFGE